MINRRKFIGLSCGASAIAFSTHSVLADSAARLPERAQSGNVEPMSLVAPELRGALVTTLEKLGDFKVDAHTLETARRNGVQSLAPAADPPWERQLVPGPPGAPPVPVYVINSGVTDARRARPAILHMHGGGYVIGTARSQLSYLQSVARELDCVVVTVDYRLAPETPFPGSLEDNYAALRWLFGSADRLGIDPRRVAVMGESAGGGHAAMLAIAARDRGEFPLVMQALIYPMLDDRTGSSTAVPAHVGRFLWTAYSNRYAWSALLGQPAGARHAPRGAVPARLTDLSRLPPTFVGVGSLDLFVQEDIGYAQRLIEAGVSVELDVVPGAYHAFDFIAADAPLSKQFKASQFGALRRAFA
jgi:acetyl esterase/lipase